MNCFNHDVVTACGVCTNCGRAICKDCLFVNQGGKVLCSAKCEEQDSLSVQAVFLTLKKAKDGASVSAWFLFGIGAIFLVCGALLSYRGLSSASLYFLLCGAAFIAGGAGYLRIAKRNA